MESIAQQPSSSSSSSVPSEAREWLGWWLSGRSALLSSKLIKTQLRHISCATEFSYVFQSPFRVASSLQRLVMGFYGGQGTVGAYYPLFNYVKYRVSISLSNQHHRVHELTHALGWLKKQERAIAAEFFRTKEWRNIKGRKLSVYYDNPWEIYSRLMEFRFESGLMPGSVFSSADVQSIRASRQLRRFNLSSYSDSFLLFLLNRVA